MAKIIIGSNTKTLSVAAVAFRAGLRRIASPKIAPPSALTTSCPAMVDPTPSCFRWLYPPTRPIRARNGPGGIKIDSRSPMIARGVATPKQASNNITTIMAMPAMIPASNPAENAFVLLMHRASYKFAAVRKSNCTQDNGRDIALRCPRTAQRAVPTYNFSNATLISVARIRAPATKVPRSVPETFE